MIITSHCYKVSYKVFKQFNYSTLFIDLFDDEGFSLSDINKTIAENKQRNCNADDVYFLDSDEEQDLLEEEGDFPLDEEVNLQKAMVVMHACT